MRTHPHRQYHIAGLYDARPGPQGFAADELSEGASWGCPLGVKAVFVWGDHGRVTKAVLRGPTRPLPCCRHCGGSYSRPWNFLHKITVSKIRQFPRNGGSTWRWWVFDGRGGAQLSHASRLSDAAAISTVTRGTRHAADSVHVEGRRSALGRGATPAPRPAMPPRRFRAEIIGKSLPLPDQLSPNSHSCGRILVSRNFDVGADFVCWVHGSGRGTWSAAICLR